MQTYVSYLSKQSYYKKGKLDIIFVTTNVWAAFDWDSTKWKSFLIGFHFFGDEHTIRNSNTDGGLPLVNVNCDQSLVFGPGVFREILHGYLNECVQQIEEPLIGFFHRRFIALRGQYGCLRVSRPQYLQRQ